MSQALFFFFKLKKQLKRRFPSLRTYFQEENKITIDHDMEDEGSKTGD